MKKFVKARMCLVAAMGLLMACSSTKNNDSAAAPQSDDLLELLTGFGESLSKRNFTKAVDYMVPEEKAMLMENGQVPPDKQKALLALPLQKLIRHPAIRVEHGKIAGIYTLMPTLNQAQAQTNVAAEANANPDSAAMPSAQGETATAAPADEDDANTPKAAQNDPKLRETVNKFFSAVNRKNWSGALALMSDSEKKLLLDDKGRLKESSKQRLAQIDQKNKDALLLQDGKLTGVTLLLPAE